MVRDYVPVSRSGHLHTPMNVPVNYYLTKLLVIELKCSTPLILKLNTQHDSDLTQELYNIFSYTHFNRILLYPAWSSTKMFSKRFPY